MCVEKIAHTQLLHILAHFLERLTKVIGNPDFSFHIAPFTLARRFGFNRAQLCDGSAALGDNEALARTGLAQKLGEFGLGRKGPDFDWLFWLRFSGLHNT